MIGIHNEVLETICVSAEQCYPNECCGLLIGSARDIKEVRILENAALESRRRRYMIRPIDLLEAENYVRGNGLEIIGVYHSHPDHPARPSDFDRANAVPHYLYVIVNVANGRRGEIGCWSLDDWDSEFVSEELRAIF